MSNTTSDVFNTAERYVAGSASVIIAAAALLGNGLVFCAFFKFKKLRKPTNYFIVNLAVYDFLVGCLPITFWASYLFTNKPARTQGGFDIIYWLWECLDILCGMGSAASLTFVAIDRYICIKDALRYHSLVTTSMFYSCLAFIWFYSLIPVVLSYLKTRQLIESAIFRYYIFIAGLIIPICVMAFCYVNIFFVTVRLNREMRDIQRLGTFAAPMEGAVNGNYQSNDVELQPADDSNSKSVDGAPSSAQASGNTSSCVCHLESVANGNRSQNGCLEAMPVSRSSSIVQLTKRAFREIRSTSDTGWGNNRDFSSYKSGSIADEANRQSEQHSERKTEVKAAQTLSLIMGAFLLTWTPFIMAVMLYQWNKSLVKYRWTAIVKCLHYSNSGLNPFLYSILNVNFRKAFASILFCKSNSNASGF